MSKAEEAAWKWATENKVDPFSMGQAYGVGYAQAEKDLALTWEDVKRLCDCFMDVGLNSNLPARSKALYEEVLRMFNETRK